MADGFLFEHEYRGRLWRFQPVKHRGSWRLHVWAWFCSSDGSWRPCKGNEVGFVVPRELLAELAHSLTAFAAAIPPDDAE